MRRRHSRVHVSCVRIPRSITLLLCASKLLSVGVLQQTQGRTQNHYVLRGQNDGASATKVDEQNNEVFTSREWLAPVWHILLGAF